jgi:hypothetical protein
MLDAETSLGFTDAQSAEGADTQSKSAFRRHTARIKLLAGRYGCSPTHRRRKIQEPFIAERLAAVRLGGLLNFIEFLEDSNGRSQWVGLSQPIGHLSQLLCVSTQVLRTSDNDFPCNSPHLETLLRHQFFRFDCRSRYSRCEALLLSRIDRVGCGTQQDRQINDLGDRHDATEPLDLSAEFMTECGDFRVLTPAIPIRRDNLANSRAGDAQSICDIRLAWPLACVLALGSCDSQQSGSNIPFRILLRIANAHESVVKRFKGRRSSGFRKRRFILGFIRFDVWKPVA